MKRPACAALWNTPMVHVEGDVTTCCLDEHLENKVGNLRESSLSEIWNGPVMHKWRLAQIQGRFAESGPLCDRCNWRSAGSYPEEKIEAYLEKTSETELLKALKRQT
ncbi:MAG: SPASM domain-containing protein [Myxococcota bacterium]|nr:SPASM domain-containing protein [Myxococcota bacterium]